MIDFIPSTMDLGTVAGASADFEFNTGNNFTGSTMFTFSVYAYKGGNWELAGSKDLSAAPNITTNISFSFIAGSYNWTVPGGIKAKLVITPKNDTNDVCFTGTATIKERKLNVINPTNNSVLLEHPELFIEAVNYKDVPCHYTINGNIGYDIDFYSDNSSYSNQLDPSLQPELVTGLNTIRIYAEGQLKQTVKYTKQTPEEPGEDPIVELLQPVSTRKYCDPVKVYAKVQSGYGQKVSICIDGSLLGTYDIDSDDYILQETINSFNDNAEHTLEIKRYSNDNVLATTKFTRISTPDPAIEFTVNKPVNGFVTNNNALEVDYTIKNAMNRYKYVTVRDSNGNLLPTLTGQVNSNVINKTGTIGISAGKNTLNFYACDFEGDPFTRLLKTVNVTLEGAGSDSTVEITRPKQGEVLGKHPWIMFTVTNGIDKNVELYINDTLKKEWTVETDNQDFTYATEQTDGKEGLNNVKIKMDGTVLAECNYTKITVTSGVYFSEPQDNSTHDIPPRIGVGYESAKGIVYTICLNGKDRTTETITQGSGVSYAYDVTPYSIYGQNTLQLKVNGEVVDEIKYNYTRQGEPTINVISPIENKEYDEHPELIVEYKNVHSRSYRVFINNYNLEQHNITEHEQTFNCNKIGDNPGAKDGMNIITIKDVLDIDTVVKSITYYKKYDKPSKSITITSPEEGSTHYTHPSLKINIYNCLGDTCDIFVNGTQDFQYTVKSISDSATFNLEDATVHEGFNTISIKINNVEYASGSYYKIKQDIPDPPGPEDYKLKLSIPNLVDPVNSLNNIQVISECTNNTRLEVTVEYGGKQLKDYLDFDAGVQTKYFTFNSNLWNEIPENSPLKITFKLIDNTDNSKFQVKQFNGIKTNSIINISYSTSTSEKVTKLLLIADYIIDENIKVEFTNNPNATSPTWEDITYKFLTNKIHIFPNIDVDNPGYGFRITMTGSNSRISNLTVYTS